MQMRMIIHIASPCVQHAEETGLLCADVPLGGCQSLQCVAGRLEQRVVAIARMTPHHALHAGWHRECDEEVMTRQQFRFLLCQPSLRLVGLTQHAVPVATRASHHVRLAALRAGVTHHTEQTGSTGRHRLQDFLLLKRHVVAKSLKILRRVPPQHLTDRRAVHGRPRQRDVRCPSASGRSSSRSSFGGPSSHRRSMMDRACSSPCRVRCR